MVRMVGKGKVGTSADDPQGTIIATDIEERETSQNSQTGTATIAVSKDESPLPKTNVIQLSNPFGLTNEMNEHNLTKAIGSRQSLKQNSQPSTSKSSILPPLQNIIFKSTDGKTITAERTSQIMQIPIESEENPIELDSNGSDQSSMDQSDPLAPSCSATPFALPPVYQFVSIPASLPLMLSAAMSSVTTPAAYSSQNITNQEHANPDEIVDNYSSTEVTTKRLTKPLQYTNSPLTVQIADGQVVQIQRFFYQPGMCRICLLTKEKTTSIFEDIGVDESGKIEKLIGPNRLRYQMLSVIKTLLDVEVVRGDGLPDQICVDCVDVLVPFSAFRKQIEIGQTKLNAIISQVQGSTNPTFLPPLGESDFGNTGVFKHHESIVQAKELLSKSQFSHNAKRSISDGEWDKIFKAMSMMIGYKSVKLKEIEHYAFSPPFVSGWFCYTCNNTIHDTQEGYEQHFKSLHQIKPTDEMRYPCDICGGEFPMNDSSGISQNYGEHWIQHFFFHECNVCSKRLPSAKGLKLHMKSAHVTNAEKRHKCDVCDKSFLKKAHLESHKKIHLDPKDRKKHLNYCEICGKGLASSMAAHIATVHNQERPWTCEICSKMFKRKEILVEHRETVHHNIKKYECEVCGEFFKSHGTKAVHVLRHTGDQPYFCEVETCGKRFYSLHSLKSHKIKHKEERDFQCTECGKAFKRRMYLTEHMRIHSGEMPHECHVCGRVFRMRSNYFKHIKIHKRKNEDVEEQDTQPLNA